MQRRAIFFDRDGVLNEALVKEGKPYPPATLGELVVSNDTIQALKILKNFDFLLIGATNQPDVARGKMEQRIVEVINSALMKILPLDDMRVCYHDDIDGCVCRKPLPGLLLQAAKDYDIDLKRSVMIGDRWKDIEAGQRAGCKTVWLNKNYSEPGPNRPPDLIVNDLLSVIAWIANI